MAKMYQKLAICGGEGGTEWDDDVYEGVRKVYVGQDLSRITYIKFEYVKEDGEVVTREYGTITQQPREFVLEHPDEHIIAVEGSYNKVALTATELITSLVFKTSKGKTSPTFGPNLFGVVAGTKFVLEDEGKKIVGFHGRSDNAIDALGVYILQDSPDTPFPLYKLGAQGGTEGTVWDDGSNEGVLRLRIGKDDSRITYLEFDYVKFVVEHPDEYIKSVEATYDKPSLFRNTVITSLKLETSKGRTALFGYEVGKKFVLKQNGHKLVGFHGKEGEAIDALGAYFGPVSTPQPEIGDAWYDGTGFDLFDGVSKIRIGLYEEGIAFLQLVSGDEHGKMTSLGVEETISIRFKRNKRETKLFGKDSGEKFSIEEKGRRVTQFHGRASTDAIYTIEVFTKPILVERKPATHVN
ncbi:hypothetical protein EUTSA_v10017628mg [Eutrema salsugineum]|uniref:Jacalin-type lectin domain-containing protein n=1 Tax=Eutrema salsugineum TaxID=72664 RepID=V4MJ92_EUTSA|nr:hypothetical protein EUTSA_v10017628mg [Eutrema salsugineum]